jgi:hypothetical protein
MGYRCSRVLSAAAVAAGEIDIGRGDRRALGRGVDHGLDAGCGRAVAADYADELLNIVSAKREGRSIS